MCQGTATPIVDARVDYEIRAGISLGESEIYDLARRLESDRAALIEALRRYIRYFDEAHLHREGYGRMVQDSKDLLARMEADK